MTFAMNGEWIGKMRSTPSLFTIRRTVNVSFIPRPFFMITVPVKTWMRSLSPSTIRVCTSTVSPTSNCGTSLRIPKFVSTCWRSWLIMAAHSRVLTHAPAAFARSRGASRLLLLRLLVKVRLPQVRPALLRSQFPLLEAPPGDRAVVAAEQHVRHAHPAKLARARVLRILEQAIRKTLVGRSVLCSQCSGQQADDRIDHDHRRQLATR